ncbi:MAG: hypothetical protein AAF756_20600 [Pseudomonadota bacterium]
MSDDMSEHRRQVLENCKQFPEWSHARIEKLEADNKRLRETLARIRRVYTPNGNLAQEVDDALATGL